MNKLLHYFSLEGEAEDFDKVHASIEKDIVFKGTNLWILVFAIIVASVGLNMNSTAVIIGAMLISPLMGPINGIGYSLATYNFLLLRRALKNIGFAVGASITASTLYFLASPVSSAHSELLARVSPTIYDVLIALFGGMAGVLAIGTRNKGNVLPGVAIATALMPPLCTAGYGLATGQLLYFFGAFYLFLINAVFIALAGMIISRVLKLPYREGVENQHIKRTHRLVYLVIILTVVPSIYFGYGLVQNEKFTERASRFIKEIGSTEGSYLLKSEIRPVRKSVVLVFGGRDLTDEGKRKIGHLAVVHGLDSSMIEIRQGISVRDIPGELNETERLRGEINRLQAALDNNSKRADSLESGKQNGQQLVRELRSLYPQVTSCSYAETAEFRSDTNPVRPVVVVTVGLSKPLGNADRQRIVSWLGNRLSRDDIKVFFEK